MDHAAYEFDLRTRLEAVVDETLGVILGAGFTLALLWGMAHLESSEPADASMGVEDLRTFTIPFEPPPPTPRIVQPVDAAAPAMPLTGIELGAADSPVAIGVVPPDLEFMLPAVNSAPKATVEFSLPHTDLKPRAMVEPEVNRIYQESEVDQKPRGIVRVAPPLPASLVGNASYLRVVLLLLIDTKGRVESVRVVQSSGKARVDDIVAQTVKEEWLFSPAVRRGRKVRVMAQQAFRINISGGGSPFSLDR